MTLPLEIPMGGLDPVYSEKEIAEMNEREKAERTNTYRAQVNRERWQLFNLFVDNGMAKLELSDMSVWFTLFRHAGPDGTVSVARTYIEAKTGINRKTVTVSIQRLIEAGFLERIRPGGATSGIAVYQIRHPKKGGNERAWGGK